MLRGRARDRHRLARRLRGGGGRLRRPFPSSRAAYAWGPARDGARKPLRPHPRPERPARRCSRRTSCGRATCAPTRPMRAAVERALVDGRRRLVGEFDKPRFVTFDAGLCAHGRNRRTGCTRCLDLCPTGAITPRQGPACDDRRRRDLRRLRRLRRRLPDRRRHLRPAAARRRPWPGCAPCCSAIAEAGGRDPWCCCTTRRMARRCSMPWPGTARGCPARVLPLRVNEVSQLDLGAARRRLRLGRGGGAGAAAGAGARTARRACSATSTTSARRWRASASPPAPPRAAAIETDDPFPWPRRWPRRWRSAPAGRPASFLPLGTPREVLRAGAARGCTPRPAPRPPAPSPMPALAPFGLARVDDRGLHALPRLHHGLPDRRLQRQPRDAAAPLPGGGLRAMRPLRRDLPGEGDQRSSRG